MGGPLDTKMGAERLVTVEMGGGLRAMKVGFFYCCHGDILRCYEVFLCCYADF